MTLLMMSLPLARVLKCLFTFALIGGNLTTRSTGSHRGFGGGASNFTDVVASLLPFPALQAERLESLLAG